jgi:hypothetical protein
LDAEFRALWPDPAASEYSPFNDGEARPTPPGPYCVYEKAQPVLLGHHSGKLTSTENQLLSVPVTFQVHAKTSGSQSGKARARLLAEKVASAFDPGNGAFDISPDSHVYTVREPDFHLREGDEEWVWVVPYSFVIDAEYDSNPSV